MLGEGQVGYSDSVIAAFLTYFFPLLECCFMKLELY